MSNNVAPKRIRTLLMKASVLTFFLVPASAAGQTVYLRPAPPVEFPGIIDSNSPAYWRDGTRYLFNSYQAPIRMEADSNLRFQRVRSVLINGTNQFRWIEAVWTGEDGKVYAWYHREGIIQCGGTPMAMPEIGALVSTDGANFEDLGVVLRSGDAPDCNIGNQYFVGGHGDFSVIPDRSGRFLYFVFTNYGGPLERQGIALARMAIADRDKPAGAVWKYRDGGWSAPGLGGAVHPIFAAAKPWNGEAPHAFWGPSIHWNTAINKYVILMSEAIDFDWSQGGAYLTFADDIADPTRWTQPIKLMDPPGWYPQVLGYGDGETDSVAGGQARLFISGYSAWDLIFEEGPLQVVDEISAPGGSATRKPRNLQRRRVK